jgi:Alginate export
VSNSIRIYRGAIVAALCSIAATAAGAVELLDGKSTETKLDLNADFVTAGFMNSNPWFGRSKEFLGADTNHWLELGFEPKLALETPVGRGTLVAQLSGVYTRTWGDDASGLTIGLSNAEAFTLEQANVGWKAKDLFPGIGDHEFSLTVGNQDYSIGTGMIINDGGGDGGPRGGWYIGMRKAFEESVIARLKTSKWLIEGFHLNNRPRAGGIKGEADGANVEYTFADAVLGGSYIYVNPKLAGADSLNVVSGRIDWGGERNLHLRGEYIIENNAQINAAGWYAEADYSAKAVRWSPIFSYRYAHFDGNKPGSSKDGQWREIAYGSTDYGYWYQGEIAGNYPLGNANVVSQMVRAKFKPLEKLTSSVIYYRFTLDQPGALAQDVTDDHFGDEIDVTADWQATDKLALTGVLAALLPGEAAKQWTGGNKSWLYSMLLVSYAW